MGLRIHFELTVSLHDHGMFRRFVIAGRRFGVSKFGFAVFQFAASFDSGVSLLCIRRRLQPFSLVFLNTERAYKKGLSKQA